MLRWTMAGETESRKTRAKASEKMEDADAKRKNARKLQKEKQDEEYGEHKKRTMRVGTILAKITANQKNDKWDEAWKANTGEVKSQIE